MRKFLSIIVITTYLMTGIFSANPVIAQQIPILPPVGTMIKPTPRFVPLTISGVRINPKDPLRFNFIIDPGDSGLDGQALIQESRRLISYFLASLTVPENDLWVNLSPYEKDRIIPRELGITALGRDMLAQDYLLKQLTASLIYPKDKIGEEFWKRVYQKVRELYGTTEIPINTFNKVWIVPQNAEVYVRDNTALVTGSRLKVMLESDYLALSNNLNNKELGTDQLAANDVEKTNNVSSDIIKDLIIPEIEKEVNEGEHFAPLRQIYHSLILAAWFKRALKESLLGKVYVDQNKIAGVDIEDRQVKEKIYQQYVEAFKKGTFNFIQEDYDPLTQDMIPRQYFSGGLDLQNLSAGLIEKSTVDPAMLSRSEESSRVLEVQLVPHGYANNFIENTLPQDLKDARTKDARRKALIKYKKSLSNETRESIKILLAERGLDIDDATIDDIAIIPNEGMLQNLGQFGHIGLGQVYDEPVMYVDSAHLDNPVILAHEIYEIIKWEEYRKTLIVEQEFVDRLEVFLVTETSLNAAEKTELINLFRSNIGSSFTPAMMRWWIKLNIEKVGPLAGQWHNEAPALDEVFAHEAAGLIPHGIEGIPDRYFKERDINLAAGRESLWQRIKSYFGLRGSSVSSSFSSATRVLPSGQIWTSSDRTPATISKQQQASGYSDSDQNFSGVDLEHFVYAVSRLSRSSLPASVLSEVLTTLGLDSSLSAEEAYPAIFAALSQGLFTTEIIDKINTVSKGNTYSDPRLGVKILDQNPNARQQGVNEAVANCVDAILTRLGQDDQKIGQFGMGVKQLLAWLEASGQDRIDVVTRQADTTRGAWYHLAILKDIHDQLYIELKIINSAKELSAFLGVSPKIESGTIVQIRTTGTISQTQKDVDERRQNGEKIHGNSQETLEDSIHRRFAFLSSIKFTTETKNGGAKEVNGFEHKRVLVGPSLSKPADSRGHIHVYLDDHSITIMDDGVGMNAETISRMFVPKEGDKKVPVLSAEDRRNELVHKLHLVHDPTLAHRVSFARNGEVIVAVDIPSDISGAATMQGGLLLEFGRLMDVSEGRDQVRIPVNLKDGEISNFQLAVNHFIDTVAGDENFSNEDKLKIINTIIVGLSQLEQGNPGYAHVIGAIRFRTRESLKNIVSGLRKDGVIILPHERAFEKIAVPQGRRVLFAHEHIFDWRGATGLAELGGVIIRGITLTTGESKRPLVAVPFTAESLEIVSRYDSTWHRMSEEDRLPIIKTDRFTAIPRQAGERLYQLAEKRANRQPLTKEEQIEFSRLAELVHIAAGDQTVTSYEVTTPLVQMVIDTVEEIARESGQPDSEAVNRFNDFLSHPPFKSQASRRPGPARAPPVDAPQKHFLVDGTVIDIVSGQRVIEDVVYFEPLGDGLYLLERTGFGWAGFKAQSLGDWPNLEKIQEIVSLNGIEIGEPLLQSFPDRHLTKADSGIVKFSPDKRFAYVESSGGEISSFLNLREKNEDIEIQYGDFAESPQFSSDGRYVAYYAVDPLEDSPRMLVVHDLEKDEATIYPNVQDFAFSRTAGICKFKMDDGTFTLFDIDQGFKKDKLKAIHADSSGNYTATIDLNGQLGIYLHKLGRLVSLENGVLIDYVMTSWDNDKVSIMVMTTTGARYNLDPDNGELTKGDTGNNWQYGEIFNNDGHVVWNKNDLNDMTIPNVLDQWFSLPGRVYRHPKFDLIIDHTDPDNPKAIAPLTGVRYILPKGAEVVRYHSSDNVIFVVYGEEKDKKNAPVFPERLAFPLLPSFFPMSSEAAVRKNGNNIYELERIESGEMISLGISQDQYPNPVFDGKYFVFYNPLTNEAVYVDPAEPAHPHFVTQGPAGQTMDVDITETRPSDARGLFPFKIYADGSATFLTNTGTEIIDDFLRIERVDSDRFIGFYDDGSIKLLFLTPERAVTSRFEQLVARSGDKLIVKDTNGELQVLIPDLFPSHDISKGWVNIINKGHLTAALSASGKYSIHTAVNGNLIFYSLAYLGEPRHILNGEEFESYLVHDLADVVIVKRKGKHSGYGVYDLKTDSWIVEYADASRVEIDSSGKLAVITVNSTSVDVYQIGNPYGHGSLTDGASNVRIASDADNIFIIDDNNIMTIVDRNTSGARSFNAEEALALKLPRFWEHYVAHGKGIWDDQENKPIYLGHIFPVVSTFDHDPVEKRLETRVFGDSLFRVIGRRDVNGSNNVDSVFLFDLRDQSRNAIQLLPEYPFEAPHRTFKSLENRHKTWILRSQEDTRISVSEKVFEFASNKVFVNESFIVGQGNDGKTYIFDSEGNVLDITDRITSDFHPVDVDGEYFVFNNPSNQEKNYVNYVKPVRARTEATPQSPIQPSATGEYQVARILVAGPNQKILSTNFSPDGQSVVATVIPGTPGTVKIWDTATGRDLQTMTSEVFKVFSPDGKKLVTASSDGSTAKIWDAATGVALRVLSGHTLRIHSVVFSPDGQRLVTASSDGTAKIWDAATGVALHTLSGHQSSVNSAVFSPDGQRVLTEDNNGKNKFWDAETGVELNIFHWSNVWFTPAVYSPDGRKIVSSSNDIVQIWNAQNGTVLFTLNGHTLRVNSVVFSPDGQRVLTASEDGTAKIWDAVTGAELHTLSAELVAVTSAVFSSDGKKVLTLSRDGTARIWEMSEVVKISLETETNENRAAAERWQSEVAAKRKAWIAQAQAGYNPVFAYLEDKSNNLAAYNSQIRQNARPLIEQLYQAQQDAIREQFEKALEAGQPMDESVPLPFDRFLSRMRTLDLPMREFLAAAAENPALIVAPEESRSKFYVSFFTHLLDLATRFDIDLETFPPASQNPETFYPALFNVLAHGFPVHSQAQLEVVPVINRLLKSLPSQAGLADRQKIVTFLAEAIELNPDTAAPVVQKQILKILEAKSRDKFLENLYNTFKEADLNILVKFLKQPALRSELGSAGLFAYFLTNEVPPVREETQAQNKLFVPSGGDKVLPIQDGRTGISLARIKELEKQRPKSGEDDDVVMDIEYLIKHLNELPEADEKTREGLVQDVKVQRESGAYTAEIAPNSKDAGASELVVDFYLHTTDDGRKEYVEEARDNGSGAWKEVALLIQEASTKVGGEQREFTGFFGTGKFTFFEGVDRVEIITNNGSAAFLFRLELVKDADGNPVDILLTRLRIIEDINVARGLTVRRIKSVENTIPELDQMISRRAWKTFAGLAQNDKFKIFLVDHDGEKQPLMVEHEILTEVDFPVLKPDGIISKLKIIEIDSNNEGILESLIKEGILDDISANEARLKPNLDEKEAIVRAIAKDKFEQIWAVLQQYLGKFRVIKTKDMPLQIIDREGWRVGAIKEEYLALVHPGLRRHFKELGINIQIPIPLIRGRSGFENESEYMPVIQKYIAVEIYKAMAYMALTRSEPQFVFEGLPLDWETNDDYWTSIGGYKDRGIFRLAEAINNGRYADAANKDLFDLLPRMITDQKTGREKKDKSIDLERRFLKFVLLLQVDTKGPQGKISLTARRLAVQRALNAQRAKREEERYQNSGYSVGEVPRTESIPFIRDRLTQGQGIATAHEQMSRVQDFIKTPETENERRLQEAGLAAALRVGLEQVILIGPDAKGEIPQFAGAFRTYQGKATMFLNIALAWKLGQADTSRGFFDGGVNTIVHELAHWLEKLMKQSSEQASLQEGYVAHLAGFTHDSIGPFAEAMKYMSMLWLMNQGDSSDTTEVNSSEDRAQLIQDHILSAESQRTTNQELEAEKSLGGINLNSDLIANFAVTGDRLHFEIPIDPNYLETHSVSGFDFNILRSRPMFSEELSNLKN